MATEEEQRESLRKVCGDERIADLATSCWAMMLDQGRLDASDKNLSDEEVRKFINGLHT